MITKITSSLIIFLFALSLNAQPRNIDSRDYAVLLSAEISKSPAQIKLKWQKNELATQYRIFKKKIDDKVWAGGALATLDSNTFEFTDSNIEVGVVYEYEVQAYSYGSSNNNPFNFWGFGYIATGIQIPEYDNPGKVLLLIDSTQKEKLSSEILRLKNDLRSEGWGIIEYYVERNEQFNKDAVAQIKKVIMDEFTKDQTNLKAVFILGRVAVPYSGNMNPDGHPDHQGAWPADMYYGYTAPDFYWTDISVNSSVATRAVNKNIPGDGKFDQNSISGHDVKLYVGRVDLYGMKQFHNGLDDPETDLLKKYLNKNHAYRNGEFEYNNSGIIDDNFSASSYIEGFASSGWRNFGVLTNPSNVRKADWFTTLATEGNLFSYGCGGGSYTSAGGIGNTNDFATKQVKSVFTILFGSYFGDWDIDNNFLRAPLASDPYALISFWAARPHWYLHHLALGYPVGYSARLSHNNIDHYKPNIVYTSQYPNGVIYAIGMKYMHTALMGDPTLKLNPTAVPSPSDVSVSTTTGSDNKVSAMIRWKRPVTEKEHHFNVYRSTSEFGMYKKVNAEPIKYFEFSDELTGDEFYRFDGNVYYMVRTVMEENNNALNFYNISRGEVASAIVSSTKNTELIPFSLKITPNPVRANLSLNISGNKASRTTIELVDLNGRIIAQIFKGLLDSGNHNINFNLKNIGLAQGVYMVNFRSEYHNTIEKITVIE